MAKKLYDKIDKQAEREGKAIERLKGFQIKKWGK